MKPIAHRYSQQSSGFNLTEVTVGALIYGIIMVAAFLLLNRWNVVSARNEVLNQSLNEGRKAITEVADDIRHAFYIYHYATVRMDPAIMLNGVSVSGWITGVAPNTIVIPLVASSVPADLNLLPTGYPGGPFMGPRQGLDGLATDSITLLINSVLQPTYITYFRVPQINGYGPLWNKLVKLTTSCIAPPQPGLQGGWLDMGKHWNPAYPFPAGLATSSWVTFPPLDADGCKATRAKVVTTLANDDVFFIESPHPYSVELPVSPYFVTVKIVSGDPVNNRAKSGNEWGVAAVPLVTRAYAQNVTVP
ncbi:MAG: hypothetical protein HY692_02475 [Cyanobacteria bacterium NC_groundwater_1444_Ag_S-0.65um_54_12]|nr:hypothetical protein [Cyanobacteria bacterium NC_groundwater_1444_Ag_S-0.65um_54_12]